MNWNDGIPSYTWHFRHTEHTKLLIPFLSKYAPLLLSGKRWYLYLKLQISLRSLFQLPQLSQKDLQLYFPPPSFTAPSSNCTALYSVPAFHTELLSASGPLHMQSALLKCYNSWPPPAPQPYCVLSSNEASPPSDLRRTRKAVPSPPLFTPSHYMLSCSAIFFITATTVTSSKAHRSHEKY